MKIISQDLNKRDGSKNKFLLIFMLALLSSIAPLSTDMYLPALPEIANSFNTNEALTQFSLASFFIAFAFGQLIYGPISDVYGRKKPLYVGVGIFIWASIGCVLVTSIEAFIILRFFEALGGCAGAVVARAIVNDRFTSAEAASVFALIGVVSGVVPMAAPVFGAALIEFFPWEGIFFVIFSFGFLVFISIILFLEESAPHLQNKIQHRQENNQSSSSTKSHNLNTNILKRYNEVLKNKHFLLIVLSLGIVFSALFAYITTSSFIFINHFGLSSRIYGAIFGINALGYISCSLINSRLVFKVKPLKIIKVVFTLMCIFSLLLLLFSKIFENAIIFEISLFCTMSCLGFLMPNLMSEAMRCAKEHAGTASAILGFMQFGFAGIMSFLVSKSGANTPFLVGIFISSVIFLGAILFVCSQKIQVSKYEEL